MRSGVFTAGVLSFAHHNVHDAISYCVNSQTDRHTTHKVARNFILLVLARIDINRTKFMFVHFGAEAMPTQCHNATQILMFIVGIILVVFNVDFVVG